MADEAPTNYYTFEGQGYSSFSVHITPAFFTELVGSNPDWLAQHESRLARQEPFVLLPQCASVSPTQRALIEQIMACPYGGR
ncbi:hypothetical protein [Hymenobacter cellulosilyticus]|uniref:Uncharacterized protein n=1 Tax=Hymenobacter cellulosilyticus TaxID=2932248 RepID=A0A8T9Q290_9BACT|nr:hypothetical protein [Hymenobacter cellulosilyticus]UOQ71547.1 hypothetical protein MUN79_23490 [Hymenobacter cellulosilyticus]